MPKSSEPVLRIACLALAALLLLQVVSAARRTDPLAGMRVPTVESALRPATIDRPAASAKVSSAAPIAAGQTNAPSEIQARIDRIAASEILGPVPRPMLVPVTLLGIAGQDAFLRAPNGQTGLLRTGEELGGIKLLQIGTNRVLVEQDGQKKELTIFSGFGSQSLLPNEKENPK
jgi:hypothetical protein